jgi:ORF6N domain
MQNKTSNLPVPQTMINRRIYLVRGREVMLDSDLAELYQIETFNLNKAVKRNQGRFPGDFMFQLSKDELISLRFQFGISNLRSQFVTSKTGRGGRRYLPYAFTEHGVAMLSSVLKSKRAIQMNIFIIRAFIQLRKMLIEHKEFSKRLQKAEKTIGLHDQVLFAVVEDVKKLKNPPKTNAIGFMWKK